MEKLHPFDSKKWGNVFNFLRGIVTVVLPLFMLIYPKPLTSFLEAGMLTEDNIVIPEQASREDLLLVHTEEYLDSLQVCYSFLYSSIHISLLF